MGEGDKRAESGVGTPVPGEKRRGDIVEFFVLMAVFVFVIIFIILVHRRREAEDPNSYTNRMKELDALERKHFVIGSLSEEEKTRLWDLAKIRKRRQTADRQMMETLALLAFVKFMSDDK